MTLIVAWRQGSTLRVVADTRIASPTSSGALILTDHGPKILITPIVAYDKSNSRRQEYPSVGFAFAGSTLIGQTVHAISSTCLQNLSGDVGKAAPALKEVADLYLKCMVTCTKEMVGMQGKYPPLEAFLFGYCTTLKELLIYHLRTVIEGDEVRIRHDGFFVNEDDAYHIGSGVPKFCEIFEEYRARNEPLSPLENFELVLSGNKVSSVGGSHQYAVVTPTGVSLVPSLVKVDGESFGCRLEVLGCDLGDLEPVGNFSIGHFAMAAGSP